MEHNDRKALVQDLLYHRYQLTHDSLQRHFKTLKLADYIVLRTILKMEHSGNDPEKRIYLQDLADNMSIPLRRMSRLVGSLRDRGLVKWSHDGCGSDGTYVQMTDSGRQIMNEQDQNMDSYYGRVIDRYGEDQLRELLSMLKRLEDIIRAETEGEDIDYEDDEG